MVTKQDYHTSQTKTNPGTWEVTKTIPDGLQRHDMTHPSRISGGNPDRFYLVFECLTERRTKIREERHPTTRSFELPATLTSQTQFDSIQQTIQIMSYLGFIHNSAELRSKEPKYKL